MTYPAPPPPFVAEPPPYRVGEIVTYYHRDGMPGREVAIVACTPHPLHRWIVTFRYDDGREKSRTYARFHTQP